MPEQSKSFLEKIHSFLYVSKVQITEKFEIVIMEAYRCLVLVCAIVIFRLEVSRFCDLSQFIDLWYFDFGCFSATFRLVFDDIITCNDANRLKLTQSKD